MIYCVALSLLSVADALRLPPALLGSSSSSPALGASAVSRLRSPLMMGNVIISETMEPIPELSAEDMVRTICEGLRRNDLPHSDAGIERLYHFTTPQGRVSIAPPPPRSGLQGGVSLEYWMDNAASSALGALTFCSSFKLVGEPQITPATNTRGQFATILVEVGNSPLEDESDKRAALRVLANAPDSFLEEVQAIVRSGSMDLPVPPVENQIKTRFWFSLEQERRPPLAGCWLLKEILPLKKTVFQALNEGGEEFEGEDTG